MTAKKAIYTKGISASAKNRIELLSEDARLDTTGVGGSFVLESVPEYITTSTETVNKGNNNSWIVLGRDRPAGRLSGYGGIGDTQCGSVDIVVGRMGSEPLKVTEDNEKVFVDPNFTLDSARIYISQKTDIDKNFGLVAGSVGDSKTKSGIGIKADGVRIIAREGIKLVTRTDKFNSQGGEVKSISGVDIIANNDEVLLEPMVKGDRLVEGLDRLVKHVQDLASIVDSLLMIQNSFNEALTNHVHISPFFGMPTTTSPTVQPAGIKCMMSHFSQTKASLVSSKKNLSNFKFKYLNSAGEGYINSRYNNVN